MKRLFDIIIASVGIAIILPIMLAIAFYIRLKLGSPILFTQIRAGRHGKPFKMYKFRSMKNTRDSAGNLLPDAERLTKFGKKLRASSGDELPALWNVLRGEMSLVGPRPLLMEYLPMYTPEQARRHEVLPGITGWAQVNGRNTISWEEKFALDSWYVDNHSLWLDLKIIWLTVHKVIMRDGISAEGEATMPKFTGNSS